LICWTFHCPTFGELKLYNGLLIGKRIEVLSALDKSLIKKNGLIVDETKNLLVIQSLEGVLLKLPKSIVTLNVYGPRDSIPLMIEGSKLAGTPDDRIKA
jgi:RNase P/RNase MRP subunit p29